MAGTIVEANLISKSDENVLDAYIYLVNIGKRTFSNNSTDTTTNSYNMLETVPHNATDDCKSAFSAFLSPSRISHTGDAEPLPKVDKINSLIEFENDLTEGFQNINTIRMMLESLKIEQNKYQTSIDEACQQHLQKADDFISANKLEEKLNKLNRVLDHITQIVNKVGRLKLILRSSDKRDYLKIHVQYHRSVVYFFDVVRQIFSEIETDLDRFKDCQSPDHRKSDCVVFCTKAEKLITELHKSVDTLEEFKNGFKFLTSFHTKLLSLSE